MATGATLIGRPRILVLDVALCALHGFVLVHKRPAAPQSMNRLDTSSSDLLGPLLFVTLKTGLHSLAISHDVFPFRLVGKVSVVHVSMRMTAHAAFAIACLLPNV